MTWTKLGDDFNDRADLIAVSRSARLLLVEMYVFGNRLLRDGRIPRASCAGSRMPKTRRSSSPSSSLPGSLRRSTTCW